MKLLSRKPKEDSFNTLDEKQIQERLYGRYHKDNTAAPPPFAGMELPRLAPKESVPDEKKIDVAAEWKALANAWFQAFRHYGAIFPWKMVGSIGVALMAAVLIVQSVGGWLADRKFQALVPSTAEAPQRLAPVRVEASKSAPVSKTVSSQTLVPPLKSSASPPAPSYAARQKFYAVQVCTYQRVHDAQDLVKQLEALHFPAFYKRSFSQANQIPLYVVFLDRTPTYAEAKARLAEFRKTELFQKFSDSFIQSL